VTHGTQLRLAVVEVDGEKRLALVLSWGMGVDSSAIIVRLVNEPWILREMGFELSDLIVITAQVGNEFSITGKLGEAHILPLLRENNIRFVQVARAGAERKDGIVVLSDTRSPTKLHMEGCFKISDEYLVNGTGPETCGRKCSIKNKGEVMDRWFEMELGPETEMVHGIGYAKGEERRAKRDDVFSGKRTARSPHRKPWHPLIEWGWDRAKCIEYLAEKTGVENWPKSCCTFCPFAGPKGKKNLAGRADHLAYLERLEAAPEEGASALLVEYNNMSFNHRQELFKAAGTLLKALKKEGKVKAVAAFEAALDEMEWSLYRVRRVQSLSAKKTKVMTNRSLERVATGTRKEIEATLEEAVEGEPGEEGGIPKKWVTKRRFELSTLRTKKGVPAGERKIAEVAENGPITEEFYVAAPALSRSKAETAFYKNWAAATA
jgi:hypothetical protein